MAKPRMCFTLLYADGRFHLSRNFDLQSVGDIDWLLDNYEFDSIARSIDELFLINVSRGETNWKLFVETCQKLIRNCFMPVAVGGGIRSRDVARLVFDNGADKVLINSAYFTDPALVQSLIASYGAQSVVASVDFRRKPDGSARVFIENGKVDSGVDLADAVRNVAHIGAGELYLTSIDRDGTGMGYDLDAIELAHQCCELPIVAAGGADTYDRLAEGLKSGFVSAAATAHLFNFMCDGLMDARQQLTAEGIQLSKWAFAGVS